MKRTMEQARAANALGKVEEIERKYDETFHEKYVSYVEALPATILMNGLGQAAATLLAAAKKKTDDAHKVLFDHLEEWLCRDAPQAPYRAQAQAGLMQAITGNDRAAYLRAQAEALAWLVWLKKFAVAYLKNPGKKPGGGA